MKYIEKYLIVLYPRDKNFLLNNVHCSWMGKLDKHCATMEREAFTLFCSKPLIEYRKFYIK